MRSAACCILSCSSKINYFHFLSDRTCSSNASLLMLFIKFFSAITLFCLKSVAMFSNLCFETSDILQRFRVVTTFFEICCTTCFHSNLIISSKHCFFADDAFFRVFSCSLNYSRCYWIDFFSTINSLFRSSCASEFSSIHEEIRKIAVCVFLSKALICISFSKIESLTIHRMSLLLFIRHWIANYDYNKWHWTKKVFEFRIFGMLH